MDNLFPFSKNVLSNQNPIMDFVDCGTGGGRGMSADQSIWRIVMYGAVRAVGVGELCRFCGLL